MAIYFNLFLFSISGVRGAAWRGDLEELKRLVEGGQNVNPRSRWQESTPLMEAAWKGHTECVEYLIQNGAQLDLMDRDGMTALHEAAGEGHLEVMKRLVEAGQDVNQRGGRRKRTPLMEAARKGHTDCVQYLIQNGAQLDLKDEYGKTALMDTQGHTDCVEYLIQNGAEMDVLTAAMIGDVVEMKRLVTSGHDVNQRGWFKHQFKSTPLMHAAEKGHMNCVKYLLQNGAQLDLKDKWGRTALKLASKKKHDSIVKLLQTAADKGE